KDPAHGQVWLSEDVRAPLQPVGEVDAQKSSPEARLESQIRLPAHFPGDIRIRHRVGADAGSVDGSEDVIAAEGIRLQVLILADSIVPQLAVGSPELQLVHEGKGVLEERLLRDSPTSRQAREEPVASALGKDLGAVVTEEELQEVLRTKIV